MDRLSVNMKRIGKSHIPEIDTIPSNALSKPSPDIVAVHSLIDWFSGIGIRL